MKKIILSLAAAYLLAFPIPTAVAQYSFPNPPPPTIPELTEKYAAEYGVSASLLSAVISCESSGNPDAVGDHGTSLGVAQIHLTAHPDITEAQALDPDFAIMFMASQISQGRGNLWTCYRELSTSNPHN